MATVNPQDLINVRSYAREKTGLSFNALGIAGDTAHGRSGYHISGDDVYRDDYSWTESARDRIWGPYASGFDLGDFGRLWAYNAFLLARCRAGDPRTGDIREFIYTLDGVTVHRWDRLGVRPGGDSSHLSHTHHSFFRDSNGRRDKDDNFMGLLKEFFEPKPAQPQPPTRPQEEEEAMQFNLKPGEIVVVNSPAMNGGTCNLQLSAAFGDAQVRVARGIVDRPGGTWQGWTDDGTGKTPIYLKDSDRHQWFGVDGTVDKITIQHLGLNGDVTKGGIVAADFSPIVR